MAASKKVSMTWSFLKASLPGEAQSAARPVLFVLGQASTQTKLSAEA